MKKERDLIFCKNYVLFKLNQDLQHVILLRISPIEIPSEWLGALENCYFRNEKNSISIFRNAMQ